MKSGLVSPCLFKEIVYSWLITPLHCKGFTWSSLTVSETSYHTTFYEWKVQVWFQSRFVELGCWFTTSETVIKDEIMVLNMLCDPIYLILALMDSDHWVCSTYSIDLSLCFFLSKDWSLPDANCYLHVWSCLMLQHWIFIKPSSIYHDIKFCVYVPSICFILDLPLSPIGFLFLHKSSPIQSLFLHLLDVIKQRLLLARTAVIELRLLLDLGCWVFVLKLSSALPLLWEHWVFDMLSRLVLDLWLMIVIYKLRFLFAASFCHRC